MKYITETMQTCVRYECDVCVCGGGVAGIAAALAARRAGAEVILLEREYILGGLATAGIVTIYLPIDDGLGHQVSFGLAEELFMLSIEHGAEAMYPENWLKECDVKTRRDGRRFEVRFNAQFFALSAERLLRKEGVKILYGASVVSAVKENDKINAILIEEKSGREAVLVRKSVVDATGDADICKFAGEDTAVNKDGNRVASWYYGFGNGCFDLHPLGGADDAYDRFSETSGLEQRFSGLDTQENSEMVQFAHDILVKDILKKRAQTPDLVPVTIATIPDLRMTRRLAGRYEMELSDEEKSFEDSVGVFSNWRKRGPVYELPFRALYGRKVRNLVTAGRCISANDAMWDITRVIPVCAVSGEAAGAAAAMTDDFSLMDVTVLQKYLADQGVWIKKHAFAE